MWYTKMSWLLNALKELKKMEVKSTQIERTAYEPLEMSEFSVELLNIITFCVKFACKTVGSNAKFNALITTM